MLSQLKNIIEIEHIVLRLRILETFGQLVKNFVRN